MERRPICVLLLMCSFAAATGVFSAKGYYCRDPDTGKLYPANTTWPSTTFCGSYTCKLRKKNEQNDNQPKRQLNYTNGYNDDTILTVKQNCSHHRKNIMDIKDDKTAAEIENIIRSDGDDVTYEKLENFRSIDPSAETNDGDRYLTESEIKTLTTLLQNVKKSDLEAILEVYNLAQDIYKEMDKNDNNIQAGVNNNGRGTDLTRHSDPLNSPFEDPGITAIPAYDNDVNKKSVSYWYEPLTSSMHKVKAVDIVVPPAPFPPSAVRIQKVRENSISDMFHKELEKPRPKSGAGFFRGALDNNDFGKLPYVFPMSTFQRVASYMRQNHMTPQSNSYQNSIASQSNGYQNGLPQQSNGYQNTQQSNIYIQPELYSANQPQGHKEGHQDKHCRNSDGSAKKLAPWFRIIHKPLYDLDRRQPILTESRINAQTLQYPLTYIHYNVSNMNDPQSAAYTNGVPLVALRNQDNSNPSYFGTTYVAQLPIFQPNLIGEVQEEDPRPIQKENHPPKTRSMPDWQTEPLSADVLNEVKANIAKQKFLPYPLRKRVNIERVGKLLRLDDLRGQRKRRQIGLRRNQDQDEYEAYLEKSTCQTDTEPGFFRMGNSSQPYPACCPQRIGS